MTDSINILKIKIERAREQLPTETLNAIASVDWRGAIMKLREKKGYNFEQLGDLERETELLLCGLITTSDYPKEIQKRMNISKAEADEIVGEMNLMVFKKIKEELIKNAERKKTFEQKKREEDSLQVEKIPVIPSAKKEVSFSDMKVRPSSDDGEVLKSAGIEVVKTEPIKTTADFTKEKREDLLEKIEHPAPSSIVEPVQGEAKTPRMGDMRSMLQDKILGSVKVPITKTEHVMENIPNTNTPVVKAPDVIDAPSSLKKDPYRLSPDE